MNVTVFYDYNCPYCYLGTMSLGRLSKEFDMELEWRGFEIHPEFTSEPKKSKKSLRSLKVGSRVSEMALKEGFQIKLPGFAANTRLCLEASEFAKVKGLFKEFHEAVYEAYFIKSLNIGDVDIILGIGSSVGLEKEELAQAIERRVFYDNIESNKKQAQENHILGVPTYIFGSFPVHGYQSTETFRKLIERALQRT